MLLSSIGVLIALMQLLASAVAKHHKPTVYFVRHGEKPLDGSNGLSLKGHVRSMCIRNLFGSHSEYDIQYIIAPLPLPDGHGWRSLDTVTPLARNLGLKVDISCKTENHRCAADLIRSYEGPGNILISWQHDGLHGVGEELGYWYPDSCPTEAYGLIWEFPRYKHQEFHTTEECCRGLDACGGGRPIDEDYLQMEI